MIDAQQPQSRPAPAGPAWTYQPPMRPEKYPEQCYYRETSDNNLRYARGDDSTAVALEVYRNVRETSARVTVTLGTFSDHQLRFRLDADALRLLHAALSDALVDIAAVEAERELQESFDRISEEMRDAEENGGPGVYYAHPDIHYVPADQVQAKVAELEAAGAKRYMVLPLAAELA